MRVTKTVKEYIEKEVYARLEPKYAKEKAEYELQENAMNNFKQACSEAALKAYNKYFDKHFNEISDFATDERKPTLGYCLCAYSVKFKISNTCSSENFWENRLNKEAKSIIDDIIVTLELGGTKKELMDMLNNI